MNKSTTIALAMAAVSWAGSAQAAEMKSISKLAFGPDNTLFAADWKEAEVHAISLPASTSHPDKPFNVTELSSALEKALGSPKVQVEDMSVRPGTGDVYLAVSYGAAKTPAIVVAQADGSMKRLDMQSAHATSVSLKKAPDDRTKFWERVSERSLTVTDMKWHDGKLYVAGLSNDTFASTLRVLSYPFDGKETMSSIEMYHTSHNQMETRAPIRAMTFSKLGDQDYMIATYVCTPLVTIPLDQLKDGAHVTGKTVAELGFGNTPQSMLTYTTKGTDGKTASYVLVTNVERNAETIALASVEEANGKPGMSKPVDWGKIEGVETTPAPISSAIAIDNLNDDMFVAVRRDIASGELQLVTMGKQYKLRLSDFVSEYDFPSYSYPAGFQSTYLKPVQDQMMKQEGFGNLVK